MAGSPPLAKRILYYSILILVLLLVIELCSRAFYYQRLSGHPVALIQAIKDARDRIRLRRATDTIIKRLQHDHYLLRPELPQADNDEINQDNMQANQAVYEPWVGFAFRDIRSRYVNVSNHIRASLPDRSDIPEAGPYR